ncbi:MAG TPA: PepSY-associated TM helix domain-containing protein [Cellvibrio sp.]|nr:PepSY-associated TM helix domain-containing protein [Cellvibrio sp.]
MKNGFRQSMAWLHTWTGLVVGWVLFFVFVTGNLGRFDTEIDRWMKPELPAETATLAQSIDAAQQRLQEKTTGSALWTIWPATNRDYPNLRIRSEDYRLDAQGEPTNLRGNRAEEILDPETAAPVQTRATGGGQLLYKMHYALHYLPRNVSDWLIGICSMFMLVAIISGVITHKKIFADFFTFRPNKGQRSWLDLHAMLATITLPFFLMITYSGLVFFVLTLFPGIVASNYGSGEQQREVFNEEMAAKEFRIERANSPANLTRLSALADIAEKRWGEGSVRLIEVSDPGDAHARVRVVHQLDDTSRTNQELIFDGASGALLGEQHAESQARGFYDHLLGLHRGLFADWILRWLYFISGWIGAIIIGSGLVLWVVKRAPKQLKQEGGPDIGHRLVESLNVGTIAGLPIAIAAYFWANRLLPIDLAGRGNWEANAMFIVWLAALLYPVFRPIKRAWIEQFWIASAALLLLPVINALTTGRHLLHSLQVQDWIFAGFDLTAITAGLLFAYGAIKLSRREEVVAVNKRDKKVHAQLDSPAQTI